MGRRNIAFLAGISFFKFHHAVGRHWPPLVVDYIFRNPEISSATDAADDESTGAAWVMSSQAP
jgi:hypothetical protein